jgi:hypothetical protein
MTRHIDSTLDTATEPGRGETLRRGSRAIRRRRAGRNASLVGHLAEMTTKGPYDQDTWSPWLTKVTYKAPKAMSLQAFKMALLKKRLAEAKAISARAAESDEARAEAAADVKAIKAELLAVKEREERMKHVKAHAEAAEEAAEAQEAADNARAKLERLREEFEEEEREVMAKSKREQESRAKALQERERKRAEQRAKLEEELERRESERHKQVLKLKDTLKEHAEAKRQIAEDAAPEEGELDLGGGGDRAKQSAPNPNANPFEDGQTMGRDGGGGMGGPSPRFANANAPMGQWGEGPSPSSSRAPQGTPGWGVAQGGPDAYGRQTQNPRLEIRAGDWMCPKGCGNVFASKMRCFRCGTPKPQGAHLHPGARGGGNGGGWGDGRRPTMGGGGRW